MDGYLTELRTSITKAHAIARETLKTTLKTMKRNYDLRVLQNHYEVGDVVYVMDTATIKGNCKKLLMPWKGTGLIVRVYSPSLYQVKMRNRESTMNHDRLKLCKDRDVPRWLQRCIREIGYHRGILYLSSTFQSRWRLTHARRVRRRPPWIMVGGCTGAEGERDGIC